MRASRPTLLLLLIAGTLAVGLPGCAVLYQAVYGEGSKIEARYPGLKGNRVAVVCVSDDAAFDANSTATTLSRSVGQILQENVEGVDVVRHEEVADWMDHNDWTDPDFVEIGESVEADVVVGIELLSFSVHEGPNLYRGRSEVAVRVYDVATGEELFAANDPEYVFPRQNPLYLSRSGERRFRREYTELLGRHIARNFFDWNYKEDFALDAAYVDD